MLEGNKSEKGLGHVVSEASVEQADRNLQEAVGCVVLSSEGRKPKRKVRIAE